MSIIYLLIIIIFVIYFYKKSSQYKHTINVVPKHNNYHSKPIRKCDNKLYPNKQCYINSDGVAVCDFTNQRNETPYSLYNVNERGKSVNQPIYDDSIENVNGNEYLSLKYVKDKSMNGGILYKNKRGGLVKASSQTNESPATI